MYEIHESSMPYFIGYDNGVFTYGIDYLLVDAETNSLKVTTEYLIYD